MGGLIFYLTYIKFYCIIVSIIKKEMRDANEDTYTIPRPI